MQINFSADKTFEIRFRDLSLKLTPSEVKIGDFLIPGPGEYEIGGVLITANSSNLRLDVEGMTIGVIAAGTQLPKEAELEQLGAIDLLFFVLGGQGLPAKEATLLLTQIEAPLVIPIIEDPAAAQQFCGKEVACETVAGAFKLTKSQLPGEGSRVLLFE